jgi:hypothetical protein
MKMKVLMVVVLALAVPAAFAASWNTAGSLDDKGPLTGLWKCKLKVDGGQVPDQDGEMDLQQTGKDVKGTGSNSGGSAPMKGTFEDGKYKLVVEAGDSNWSLDGKLDGGKLIGTWAIPSAGIKGTSECSKPESKSAAAPAAAASGAALNGLWKCVGKIPNQPDGDFQLDLDVKGDKVSGTGSNAAGSAPIAGTYKDGKFTFKIDAGDLQIEFEGKLDGAKITGTFKIPAQGITATFEGSKG